jgi:hypothetical protein
VDAVKIAGVFVPELPAQAPTIAKGIASAKKIRAALAPALDRIEANEPAFLEMAEAAGHLNDLLPDIANALKACDAMEAIVEKYAARIAEATKP